MMLLPWKLFCFRDVVGVTFPRNLISLYNATLDKIEDDQIGVLLSDGYRFTFKLPAKVAYLSRACSFNRAFEMNGLLR